MKKRKIASLILAASLVVGSLPLTTSAASVNQFTDVKRSDWYYPAVEYAVSNGLFGGTGDTTFSPNESMTRGMFVTVLGRKSGVDQSKYSSSKFNDVSASQYYAPYVNWAAANGIVGGTGNGKFSPNASITREQIAKILYEYAIKTKNDTSFNNGIYGSFPDPGSLYADRALAWATYHGIIKGSDGKLKPKDVATRAQVAQIFMGAQDVLVNTEINDKPYPGKVYGIGETWTVDGQWELTVTSVEEMSERNPYADKQPAAVYLINYTYKNLGYEEEGWDGLFLSLDGSGIVVDNAGFMGYSYPGETTYYPLETPVGATCIAQACIGVDHAGDFKITFSTYDSNEKKQTATFDLIV